MNEIGEVFHPISEEQRRAIEDVARQVGVSPAEVIRMVLENPDLLEDDGADETGAKATQPTS